MPNDESTAGARPLFGAYLRRKRLRAGWSQSRLAQELGVTSTYIHLLEKGRVDAPTDRRSEQIAAALGLEADEVVRLARRERLARYVERQGWEPPTSAAVGAAEERLGDLTEDERALVRLVRNLDSEARAHLESTLHLLLRDRGDPEIVESLERFAGPRRS